MVQNNSHHAEFRLTKQQDFGTNAIDILQKRMNRHEWTYKGTATIATIAEP